MLIRCARSLRQATVSGSCLVALSVRQSAPAKSGHKPLALSIDQPCSSSPSWRLFSLHLCSAHSKEGSSCMILLILHPGDKRCTCASPPVRKIGTEGVLLLLSQTPPFSQR